MNATWEITRWPFPLLNDPFMLMPSTCAVRQTDRHFSYDHLEIQTRRWSDRNVSTCTTCSHPTSPGRVLSYRGLPWANGDDSSQIGKTAAAFMLAVTVAGIAWMAERRQNLLGQQRGRRWRSWKGKAMSVAGLRQRQRPGPEQTHCINSWETHRKPSPFLTTCCKAHAVRWVTISTWTGQGQFEAVHARADRVGQLCSKKD